MIKVLDTTLREGEQNPGVKFTSQQKVAIAELLDQLGIDIIEAGHPFISDHDKECVHTVANLGLKAAVLAHARAKLEDIDAVCACGAEWVGIWSGINQDSLTYKYHRSKDYVATQIREAINYAVQQKLKVRFTIEDATRTEVKDILMFAAIAETAGASVLSLSDTVGTAVPEQFFDLVRQVKNATTMAIEVHCHNDLNLALANSLAAHRAGASIIDVTVNGLGERAGITSLAELCTTLKLKYDAKNNWDLSLLPELSAKVAEFSGVQLDDLRAIIGHNAFTHTAKLHIDASRQKPSCYEPIDPGIVGRTRTLLE